MRVSVITRPTSSSRRRRSERRAAAEAMSAAPHPVERCPVDLPQDRATYACACGYVFAAAVCTSVACPHCGDAQAW